MIPEVVGSSPIIYPKKKSPENFPGTFLLLAFCYPVITPPKHPAMSLLVIGSVAFDALETPFGKTDKIIGGAATYISLSASYSVKPVKLVAVVGDDFPQSDIALLEKHGVDVEGL